ncbi:MAG: cytochrome b N-terminal domain-containing protein [Candidatus Hodgkinia cicadicola]
MKSDIIAWTKGRFVSFKVPRYANLLYVFGGVLLFGLMLQILTGVSMAIHYVPTISDAFLSINLFVRKFEYGWLVRAAHVNGASLIFCALYAHIFKAVYYRSYIGSRKTVWLVGSLIHIMMMCISFMGYVLPWGQLSYWAAVVITNFVESVPLIGKWLRLFLLGARGVREPLIRRFFVFHCILPFVLIALVILHITLVHAAGQNNPILNRMPVLDSRVSIYPVYLLKDVISVCVYLLVLCLLCLVAPNMFINSLNYEPANFYVTPNEIKPEWYLMHYYSVLRIFESKLVGMLVAILSLVFTVLLPYTHSDLSSKLFVKFYRPCVIVLFLSFLALGVLGTLRLTYWLNVLARLCTFVCALFFFFPIVARLSRVLGLSLLKWLR